MPLLAACALSLLIAVLGGCASTPPPETNAAPAPKPGAAQRPGAPTAQEMETPLGGRKNGSLPRVSSAAAPFQGLDGPPRTGPRPEIPPIEPGASPLIDERVTMNTEALHGAPLGGPLPPKAMTLEEAADAASPLSYPAPTVEGLAARSPQGYTIGAGDMLQFTSFNDEKLSREEVVVRYDGHISLPLISDIEVASLSRDEAEARVRQAYRGIFRDPQLSLTVRSAASKSYTLVGDIDKPGRYPYTQTTTLIEALSIAGGLRARNQSASVGGFVGITGQLTKAFVVRRVDGSRTVFEYDLRHLGESGEHASESPIYPGDLIYVPEGVNLVYLLGESRNPVIIELTEGMTLLQLLSLAGGFNESSARLSGVVLMRQVDRENTEVMLVNIRQMLRTGRDMRVQPGDIVYLPQKRLLRLQEFVQRFTGIFSPVINLYRDAVDAYYQKDLIDNILEERNDSTLSLLNELQTLQGLTPGGANRR